MNLRKHFSKVPQGTYLSLEAVILQQHLWEDQQQWRNGTVQNRSLRIGGKDTAAREQEYVKTTTLLYCRWNRLPPPTPPPQKKNRLLRYPTIPLF
jgi:hypothetical protein